MHIEIFTSISLYVYFSYSISPYCSIVVNSQIILITILIFNNFCLTFFLFLFIDAMGVIFVTNLKLKYEDTDNTDNIK